MADLAVWQRTIVDEKGDIIPGAEVSVRSYPDGSLITLYEGPDGAQVKGNPFSAGPDGFARFWADSQRAEIVAHGAGSTIRWIVDLINADEVIGDAVSEATAAAAVAVGEAEAAADRAEAARDAAQLNAHIYPTTADGLAATTDGDYFSVPSEDDDEYLILYRNDSGSATEVRRYPSAEAVDHVLEQTEQSTRVAVDLASGPSPVAADFTLDGREPIYAIVDETGQALAAWGQDGITEIRQTLQDFSSDTPLSFALVDEAGQVVIATDTDGRIYDPWRAEFRAADSEIAAALVDEEGRVLLAWDRVGSLLSGGGGRAADSGPPQIPYLDGASLRAVGADDSLAADLGEYEALALAPGNSKSVRAVLDWPALGPVRSVTAGNGILIPDADNVLHVVIGLGQSLMQGARSADTMVSTEPLYDEALMFEHISYSDVRLETHADLDTSLLVGFTPLRSVVERGGTHRGQTPMETFAFALSAKARELGIRYKNLNFTAARPGTGYADLKKGSDVYAAMVAGVERAKELAEAQGLKIIVDGCILRHGEAGSHDPSYYGWLLEWQADVDADVRAITGQQAPVHFLMAQPSSLLSPPSGVPPQSPLAMVEAHNTSPYHHLSGPDYGYMDLYSDDYLHGTGPFYFVNGEYLARAWAQAMWTAAAKSKITQITGAARSGTTVTLTYEVPEPPLVFDTSTITEIGVKGFQYRDSSGLVAIASAAIVDDGVASGVGQIALTLAATPTGADEQVEYALNEHQELPRLVETVPRGNVRDSSADLSLYDGRNLYNWAVLQRVPVTID